MKILHAGDVHLDSALAGLSAHDDAPLDLLRGATRHAFTGLIDLALAERVDFLLLPGDLFDTGWKDFSTGIYFMRQVARLHEAGIPVLLLRGNHDSDEDMTRSLAPPPNLYIFGVKEPQTFRFAVDGLDVAIHGQSFRKAATTDNLAANYRPEPGCFNIALLHTALGGYAEHVPYAPCTLNELKNAGMNYWALGHVHEHAILHDAPYIAFSGNLQGRHSREPGPRGALLVTVAHGVVHPPERVHTDVLRWQVAHVDLAGTETMDEAMSRVGATLREKLDEADGRHLACRVLLTGKTAVHRELASQPRALRQNVLAQAMYASPEKLWIEKINVDTAPPRTAEEIAARADGLAELQALLGDAALDPEFIASLKREFDPLMDKLPREALTPDATVLQQIAAGDYAGLIAAVTPSVIDRIGQET